MRLRAAALAILATLACPTAAEAQSLPFLFVDGPATTLRPRAMFLYDAAVGDRSLESVEGNGLLHRVVAAGRLTPHLTVLGRVESTTDETRQRYSEQLELNWQPSAMAFGKTPFSVTVGARREFQGANVLLAGVGAAHTVGSSLFGAQLRAERPLEEGRDAVDLITSVGWSHRLSDVGRIGVEAIGQDLEGFWSAEEAEGGATLFAGPTLALAPGDGSRWAFVVGAGPVLRATHSSRSSGAPRDIVIDRASGYLVRTSLRFSVGR